VTHATAIVGIANGTFAQALGSNVTLEPHTFNAGPEATEALFSNAIERQLYLALNPAINAFIKSSGQAIRIVSGRNVGRRIPGCQGRHQLGRPTSRARRWLRRSSVTRRTSRFDRG
jgi:hypothetical protein